jgi:hypothetical protein
MNFLTLRECRAWMACIMACAACATAQADNLACGAPRQTPTSPSDLAHQESDLSLAHWADQPAGPVTCSYGYFAAKCGDYETAHRIFDKCIAKGYAGAMIWKGLLLEEGNGAPRNPVQAAALYKQAAESGTEQYATLGKLHYASALYEGNGVPKNEAEARKWFQQAAAEGSADAQEFLQTGHHTGSRNERGEGVGTPGQPVSGQHLLRQITQTLPTVPGLPLVLAALLAVLVGLGAWRQGRFSSIAAR